MNHQGFQPIVGGSLLLCSRKLYKSTKTKSTHGNLLFLRMAINIMH